jgi:deazaflavin-dependent oxidoreductase (nitroreductase family)
MNVFGRAWNAVGGPLLARTGRVGRLTTTGRRSGQKRTAHVGFARREDGRVVIGAGGTGRAWVANLAADPSCSFAIRGEERAYRANRLEDDERDAALAELKATLGSRGDAVTYHDVFLLVPEG